VKSLRRSSRPHTTTTQGTHHDHTQSQQTTGGATQGTERFTRIAWKRKRELVQEMVFYKNVSGIFWVIIQRYLYPTYKPRCFSLTLAKLDDTGVPISHPLRGWYSRITAWLPGWLAGWLWDNWTAPLGVAILRCCYPALRLWFLLWYPVPRLTLVPAVVPRPSADSSCSSGSPLVLPRYACGHPRFPWPRRPLVLR